MKPPNDNLLNFGKIATHQERFFIEFTLKSIDGASKFRARLYLQAKFSSRSSILLHEY